MRFDRDSQRYLNFAPGAQIQFALIANDTLDRVKADLATGKTTDKVLFSLPEANAGKASQAKFTVIPNNGGYEIAWEDNLDEGKGSGNRDFNDLVLKVQTLDNVTAPIGTGLQGKSAGEVLDFRDFKGQNFKVDTISVSDAGYLACRRHRQTLRECQRSGGFLQVVCVKTRQSGILRNAIYSVITMN